MYSLIATYFYFTHTTYMHSMPIIHLIIVILCCAYTPLEVSAHYFIIIIIVCCAKLLMRGAYPIGTRAICCPKGGPIGRVLLIANIDRLHGDSGPVIDLNNYQLLYLRAAFRI